MNSEHIKNNDPLQLQQMIIFLKAELAKYQLIIKQLQDSDHYSLVVELEQENSKLQNDNDFLTQELQKIRRQLELQENEHKERTLTFEAQTNQQDRSIAALQKKEKELRSENNQLIETIGKIKEEFHTSIRSSNKQDRQVASLHRKLYEYQTKSEQLEKKLIAYIEESHSQVHSKIGMLEQNYQDRIHSDKMRQYLLDEIDMKNKTIGKLQKELAMAKKQTEKQQIINKRLERKIKVQEDRLASIPKVDSESLAQLDQQIKEVLDQTLAYEKNLNAKFLVLNDLEQKLHQLAIELTGNPISKLDS